MADTTSPAATSSPKSQKSDTPPAADAAPIEVGDDNPADDDSALGTEASSSSASISSSILDYRTMHGRTYHSDRGTAQYCHHLLTIASEDKLHHAPIKKDIEESGPCSEIEDCTQPWTFHPDTFDYIHMRYLIGSVKDWNGLFEQAFRACKPGGWVESFEGAPIMQSDDGSVPDDSAMAGWGKTFIEAGKRLERSFTVVDDNVQEEGMAAAGLVDIESRIFKIPIGRWPKDQNYRNIGLFAQEALEGDIEGHVVHVADLAWGWSKEQVMVYCAKLRKEIRSGKHHPYYRIKIVYGRKPE
ncbi:hypothetical protein N0V84_001486 [Fusarium piperis]|uniref:Methyltransferase n=1 Tax=Fusarium piperis TaxID=1435070 RepID=A0A9W8WL75_9HYPO|nr:hypothetical protein N0V84_001486 [Fusarium piperis]